MDWVTNIAVHESASPEFTRQRIARALARNEVDSSLLYAGLGQTLRWTALHHALSPAQLNPDFLRIYQEAFAKICAEVRQNVIHVVSLGCGDGTKDTRCLEMIRDTGRTVIYTPADFSMEMALAARTVASSAVQGLQATPLVCHFAECSVLPAILKGFDPSGAERVILFLGMIHNYWPPDILRSVIYPLRSQDQFLVSANLAPARRYESALEGILEQYDNEPTRNWLMGGLGQLGITSADGELFFSIASSEQSQSLRRIQADFVFARPQVINFFGQRFSFAAGDKLRAFYSYRFTMEQTRGFLHQAGLSIFSEWATASEEEALFLCRRAP